MAVLRSEHYVSRRSRLSVLICLSTVALAFSSLGLVGPSAFARPKDDVDHPVPEEPPPRESHPEESAPDEQPRPVAWPPIDGSVVVSHDPEVRYLNARGFYARVHPLPLCEWGKPERSFIQFLHNGRVPGSFGPWTCSSGHESGGGNCTLSDGPEPRPLETSYSLRPRELTRAPSTSAVNGAWNNPAAPNLVWPDSSAVYNTRFVKCSQDETPDGVDKVSESRIQGAPYVGSNCSSADAKFRSTVLAEVFGESTLAAKPTTVIVQANIAYAKAFAATEKHNYPNVELVVQVFGSSGWQDFKVASFIADRISRTLELEVPNVSPDSFVRAQLRGGLHCDAQYHEGYSVRGMRILVETCIPDIFNPGKCSEP